LLSFPYIQLIYNRRLQNRCSGAPETSSPCILMYREQSCFEAQNELLKA